jgi:hypothetical protein
MKPPVRLVDGGNLDNLQRTPLAPFLFVVWTQSLSRGVLRTNEKLVESGVVSSKAKRNLHDKMRLFSGSPCPANPSGNADFSAQAWF